MPSYPKEEVQFRCRGCTKLFRTFNSMNPHKRKGGACDSAGWDVEVPDGLDPPDGKPEDETPGGEADGRQQPEEKPGETDGQRNGGSAFGGDKGKAPRPRGSTFLEASYTKENLTPTVETLSMYDFWRQRLDCELSFNEWVQQCLDDYMWIVGLEVAVVIRPRRQAQEAAHV